MTADSLPTQLPHTLSEARLLLREDDSLLRNTFFEIVYHHHPNLADRIDEIYKLSLAWCNSESDQDFQALEKILSGLNPDELILVRCPVGPELVSALKDLKGSYVVIEARSAAGAADFTLL